MWARLKKRSAGVLRENDFRAGGVREKRTIHYAMLAAAESELLDLAIRGVWEEKMSPEFAARMCGKSLPDFQRLFFARCRRSRMEAGGR